MGEGWSRRVVGLVFTALAAVTVLWPAVAGARTGGGGSSPCAGFAESDTVQMLDFCFDGTTHFVPAHSTITVLNSGSIPHNLTAADGSLSTETIQPGGSTTIEVGDPALVRVYCTLHGTAEGGGMSGVLAVGDAAPTSLAPVGTELAAARTEISAAPSSDESPGVATFALLFGVVGAGFGTAALTLQIARTRPGS
jgi:plastocyanin